MKVIALFLAAACLAHATQVPTRTADKTYLIKQKSIYELFWHVDQPTIYHPELYQKARSFNLENSITSFTDQTAVTEFLQRWKHGMLPRGEVFSPMYPQHRDEAMSLFRVLYSANDFDIFYNTAVWARFNVNEQMYIYTLSVVIMTRPDTVHIYLPPMYEVNPHFFFNDEVLHKAYHVAIGDTASVAVKKTVGGVDHYIIPSNYSGWYIVREEVPEQHKLNYFTEDVGMNSQYFAMVHSFPTWMDSVTYNKPLEIARGEKYLYLHKMVLTRYYLERLSNDMGEINYVDVTKPIVTGYYPTMQHYNGLPVPQRPVNSEIPLHMHKEVQTVQDLHTRISNAIDSGYVVDTEGKHINIYATKDGLNHLGNVIQDNADSVNPKYYGGIDWLYRKIFSMSFESTGHNVVPSALEIFSTTMRDPVFYEMYKNIVDYWMRYKENLSPYTHEELVFPGVKIESVAVDKLMTFFDHFESLISNAVPVRNHKEAQSMLIKTRQYRLNHKPFTYHISVNSDKATKAVVRVFLGPKYDVYGHEIDISENYMNFVEMDQWIVDLKPGTNKIERGSHESVYTVQDETPSEVLYKKVVKALEGGETFTYTPYRVGIPNRLLLPKGKKEGMPFKFFVSVSPFDETKATQINVRWGPSVTDFHSLGWPLDRPVKTFNFTVPNFYMKDVFVHHKSADELNVTM